MQYLIKYCCKSAFYFYSTMTIYPVPGESGMDAVFAFKWPQRMPHSNKKSNSVEKERFSFKDPEKTVRGCVKRLLYLIRDL